MDWDWDWNLIIEVAALVVVVTATALIWAERTGRRRERGLASMPRPRWRLLDAPAEGTLRIDVANSGAAASRCCVVMQADTSLYAGTFSLWEQQARTPEMLEQFDVLDDKVEPRSLLCVARNLEGMWSAFAPNKLIAVMSERRVPYEVVEALRQATGRRYTCRVSSDGIISISPSPRLRTVGTKAR